MQKPLWTPHYISSALYILSYNCPSDKGSTSLDNARYHHARIMNEFLENNPNIILELLPPYSPELNAIERVWKIIRSKGTHIRYFASIGDLIMAVTEQFDLYSRPNNVLRRLCAIT